MKKTLVKTRNFTDELANLLNNKEAGDEHRVIVKKIKINKKILRDVLKEKHNGLEKFRGLNWLYFMRMAANILALDPKEKVKITPKEWVEIMGDKNSGLDAQYDTHWRNYVVMAASIKDVNPGATLHITPKDWKKIMGKAHKGLAFFRGRSWRRFVQMLAFIKRLDADRAHQVKVSTEDWQGILGYNNDGLESYRGKDWLLFTRMVDYILRIDPGASIKISKKEWKKIITDKHDGGLESQQFHNWWDFVIMSEGLVEIRELLKLRKELIRLQRLAA